MGGRAASAARRRRRLALTVTFTPSRVSSAVGWHSAQRKDGRRRWRAGRGGPGALASARLSQTGSGSGSSCSSSRRMAACRCHRPPLTAVLVPRRSRLPPRRAKRLLRHAGSTSAGSTSAGSTRGATTRAQRTAEPPASGERTQAPTHPRSIRWRRCALGPSAPRLRCRQSWAWWWSSPRAPPRPEGHPRPPPPPAEGGRGEEGWDEGGRAGGRVVPPPACAWRVREQEALLLQHARAWLRQAAPPDCGQSANWSTAAHLANQDALVGLLLSRGDRV